MRLLLAIRDSLSRFYGNYDTYIRLFFKFLLALCAFLAINMKLGQLAVLNNLLIVFGMSVLCGFLPSNSIVLLGSGMILGHFYGLSLEAAVVGGGLLIIGLLLYFGVAPRSSVPLILTAMGLGIGLPCTVAVLSGLLGGPLAVVGVVFGTFAYYLMEIVAGNGGNLQATASEPAEAMIQKMTMLIDVIISNREMILMMVALAGVLLAVWLIRRMAIKYAWMAAAVCGILVYVVIRITGNVLGIGDLYIAGIMLETAVALFAAWVFQVMLFSLNYKKTENIRFEDDDYYYYVKAVPKRRFRKKRRGRRAERR